MRNKMLFAKIRNSRKTRIICAFLALNILIEIASPSVAMALTSGPTSPEFSSFEPVATTDMVNDFGGDFTYNIPALNIPGPDGAGYAMSLSYHSGVSSEEEASWVGFGWTLNPGAINRNKVGFPDEFNGKNIINYHKTKPNWTQSSKFDFNIEYNSQDQEPKKSPADDKSKKKFKFKLGAPGNGDEQDPADISLSVSHTIRYNNYTGFSIANGFGVTAMGMATLNMNRSGGQNTFGFSVNPMVILKALTKGKISKLKIFKDKVFGSKKMLTNKDGAKYHKRALKLKNNFLKSSYAFRSNDAPALNYSVAKHAGASWNFSASVQLNPAYIPLGFQVGIAGNMNVQTTEGEQTQAAWGYLYSAESNSVGVDNQLFDYQVEKETTFNKHDKNLGIPYNNADMFSTSGNNVVGGFRFYHENIGSYYPNFSTSETKIRQLGVEIGIGNPFEIGLDVGIGKQTTKVKGKWEKNDANNFNGKEFSDASQAELRFMNDMGGEVDYNTANGYGSLVYATIGSNKELTLNSNYDLLRNSAKKGKTSYINYVQDPTSKLITGIEITNKEGGHNNYLLPVYTRNEAELSIGLSTNSDGSYIVAAPLDYDNPMKNQTVVGHKMAQEYATSYLLTSNTTFNYVDADGNGKPSDGDFGGWTKFGYRQPWGTNTNNWYRYRSPYAGLNYSKGRMLDLDDQTGSMSSGEKQVHYLKCIETKSHIAFFVTNKLTVADFAANFPQADYPYLYNNLNQPIPTVTISLEGSGVARKDGWDAAAIDNLGMDAAAANLAAKGNHDLEKLEKIVLFAKTDMSAPLTTTFFDYDYSLCQGIPNTYAAPGPLKDKGKLTLKRVWTESNGVNRSQIAPYQFHYEYFNQYPKTITDKYPWAATYTANPTNDARQNPAYAPEQLDPWGCYQENGAVRFTNLQTWVSQLPPSPTFDPAAWQLKRIQLPSGGEIHVNYEQKDYSSVQDKTPMSMVSLQYDPTESKDEYEADESVFCIREADIDVTNATDVLNYMNNLKKYFVDNNNKLYFKILYTYTGEDDPSINAGSPRYEYVTGYTIVHDVFTSGGKIFLRLGDKRTHTLGGLLSDYNNKKDKTLPRYVCYQELLTNGGINLGMNATSYKYDDWTGQAYANNPVNTQDLIDVARGHVLSNTIDMFSDWVDGAVKNTTKKKACKNINYGLSYFKLPVYHDKKGGGVRVKRLLTYDSGISGETGDAMLFGSEYIYKLENGASSGVATNEPSEAHEENALVEYIERKKQKWIDKIMNGRDTKQFEGPLGEHLLPAADVSHSRIVIKNIHSGKSTTGYVVNKYHTCTEFPMDVDYSSISKKDDTYKKFNLNLPLGLFNLNIHRAWVTQGYIFKLNDMHGKISSKATYMGNYDQSTFNESAFTSKTSYKYSQPGTSIQSLIYDRNTKEVKREFLNPGMEEDYTMFTSRVHEQANDFSLELDININWAPLGVSLGFGLSYSYSDNLLSQHSTSKVVHQTSYLLSTTNITDGVAQTTENLAFDKNTGDPVMTRTFDGYMSPQENILTQFGGNDRHKGHYYSLNIPAAWMYPSMEPKSTNANNTNQLTAMVGNVVTYSTNALYEKLLVPTATANVVWSPITEPLTNVVSASATTFTNNWFNSSMAADYPGLATASVVTAANQFYYPLRTYAYKENVKNANASGGRIYDAGMTTTPFKFFDWVAVNTNTSTIVPNEWYSDSKVTKYAPYGYPIEEEDVLAIKSAARFGYNNTLPVLVAQNAAYSEIKFTDFEYGFGTDPNITSTFAHSGRASYNLSLNNGFVFAPNYSVTPEMITKKGLAVKLWLKSSLSQNIASTNYGLKNPNPVLKVSVGGKLFYMKAVAQTGDWTLYIADIKNFYGLAPGAHNVQLVYNFQPNELVLVDDFRIQPLDASANCSVYNADNKLAAQFDDQHFGVFYEYNSKGQLTRKSIETEKGRKTLQEQEYNTPLINK
jgi:hypothetical protein